MTQGCAVIILCFPDKYPKVSLITPLITCSLLEECIRYSYEYTNNVFLCCHDDQSKLIEKYLLEIQTTKNLESCDIKSADTIRKSINQVHWDGDVVFLNPYVVSDIKLQVILQKYKSSNCDVLVPIVETKYIDKLQKMGGKPKFNDIARQNWLIGLSDDRLCYAKHDSSNLKVHYSILQAFPKINFTKLYEIPPVMICANWVFQWIKIHHDNLLDSVMDLVESQYNPFVIIDSKIIDYHSVSSNIFEECFKLSTSQHFKDKNTVTNESDLEKALDIMKLIKVKPYFVNLVDNSYIFDLQVEDNVFEYIKIVFVVNLENRCF